MAISAVRDNNRVPAMLGVLNTDGTTLTAILVNPSTHGIKYDDNTTGTDHGTATAQRDANRVTALIGVSSADGTTPTVVYADSSGNLLIDSS